MSIDKGIENKTKESTRWATFAEVAAKIITPIVNMVLARLLTPEAFGVVASISVVTSFADMFSDAGFQKYLIQHEFKDKKEFFQNTNVAFWTNISISVAAWFVIFLFREQLADFVGNPGLGIVMAVAALSLPLTSFSSIQMAHYKKKFDFKTLFYVRIVTACIPLVVTVPLAFVTHSYWALIIGTLASNLANAVILTICSEWKPRLYYNLQQLKQMFSYSWWILLESITVWLTSYIGTFIVSRYLSQTDVGYYKTAMSTVNQIITLISTATSVPLFSGLSALKNDKKRFEDLYYRSIRSISVFIVPLGIGIYLYRDTITAILLGSQWTSIADFIGLWGLMSSFTLIWGTYCNGVYNAQGKPYLSVLSQVLHLVVLIPVIIWGCQQGFDILCTSRALVRSEMIVVQCFIMYFVMKMRPSKYFIDTIPSFICAAVMAVVGFYLQTISPNLIWQIVSVLICIVVYFAIYAIFFKKILVEAFDTVGFSVHLKRRRR